MFENRQIAVIEAKCRLSYLGILLNVERLTVPRIIDQFGRKKCQKKRKDISYKLLKNNFQTYFVAHELLTRTVGCQIFVSTYIHVLKGYILAAQCQLWFRNFLLIMPFFKTINR